jgi:hypothetical protein
MGVRFFVGVLFALLLPRLAGAADCVAVRQDDIGIVKQAGCGELKLMSRKRDDKRPDVDIGATWIEFAAPAGPAEWRYNDWIKRQVATINFDKPIDLAAGRKNEDRFAIHSLYRSPRLISARYARLRCCGAAGETTIYQSVNVDIARWTLFSPDDFVSLGATANACWRRFADEEKRGATFARAWPFERPWADRDFEVRRIGPAMREMIGPAVVDPQPSQERTWRVFIEVLKDQARWSFSDEGAIVDFGELLGAPSGPFFCRLPNADLQTIAVAGVAIPP